MVPRKKKTEKSYQPFYEKSGLLGIYFQYTSRMELLIAEGYEPLSVAGTIAIDNYTREHPRSIGFFTGDGVAYSKKGNAKVVLDAEYLYGLNSKTKIDGGRVVLNRKQWDELEGDSVLPLTAKEIYQAHGKGFVKKRGIWQPMNKIVGKVWEHLGREQNLKEYAGFVAEVSKSNQVMRLCFDREELRSLYLVPDLSFIMRACKIGSINEASEIAADTDVGAIHLNSCCLVGARTLYSMDRFMI